MAVNLSPIGNGFQFFSNLGIPLAGGKIYTYQAGTSTPLATYSDNAGLVANANPIILGSDGRPSTEIWLTYGYNYKLILKDADDITIQTYDNIYGIVGVAPSSGVTIPAGLIAMWAGSIGSVPSGWYLCDGSNGTPNLTDRFIVGAGSTYAVNGTGGSNSATLVEANLPAHTHTATVTDPGHVHNVSNAANAVYGGGGVQANLTAGYGGTSGIVLTNTTGITVANSSTGSGTSFNTIPLYYALAYIQKA